MAIGQRTYHVTSRGPGRTSPRTTTTTTTTSLHRGPPTHPLGRPNPTHHFEGSGSQFRIRGNYRHFFVGFRVACWEKTLEITIEGSGSHIGPRYIHVTIEGSGSESDRLHHIHCHLRRGRGITSDRENSTVICRGALGRDRNNEKTRHFVGVRFATGSRLRHVHVPRVRVHNWTA